MTFAVPDVSLAKPASGSFLSTPDDGESGFHDQAQPNKRGSAGLSSCDFSQESKHVEASLKDKEQIRGKVPLQHFGRSEISTKDVKGVS